MRATSKRALVAIGLCVVVVIMAAFAVELNSSENRSRSDIKSQVYDRAVLAGALITSLFQTVSESVPTYSRTYGGATVTDSALVVPKSDYYVALLDSQGNVLANSPGFNAQARAELSTSGAVGIVRAGHTYALGNIAPYKSGRAIDLAVSFPTNYGKRTIVTGFAPATLSAFLESDLKSIPGVKNSFAYIFDDDRVALASTNPTVATGQTVNQSGLALAFAHGGATYNGRYIQQVAIGNSTWRVVLTSPSSELFASVSGFRQALPWLIFAALALAAVLAMGLGWRVIRTSGLLRFANDQLASVNRQLIVANQVLERRAAELARSNEELEQFASIASHDLQEPLRKVRTFTEQVTVLEQDNLSEKGRDYLIRANVAAARMQNLIEDLLRFSRVSTQGRPFVPVDLAQVATEVVSDLESQIDDAGAVVSVGDLPTIFADPLQIRQLFQNLLANAIKFRREGVVPHVQVSCEPSPEKVELTVKDNGIGFDPRYSQRIFRVFERLHGRNEFPGTGIGLALCRKIAERHGGSIIATGRIGEGSEFVVTLPTAARGASEIRQGATGNAGPMVDAGV